MNTEQTAQPETKKTNPVVEKIAAEEINDGVVFFRFRLCRRVSCHELENPV